jgi:hypothetical protein
MVAFHYMVAFPSGSLIPVTDLRTHSGLFISSLFFASHFIAICMLHIYARIAVLGYRDYPRLGFFLAPSALNSARLSVPMVLFPWVDTPDSRSIKVLRLQICQPRGLVSSTAIEADRPTWQGRQLRGDLRVDGSTDSSVESDAIFPRGKMMGHRPRPVCAINFVTRVQFVFFESALFCHAAALRRSGLGLPTPRDTSTRWESHSVGGAPA